MLAKKESFHTVEIRTNAVRISTSILQNRSKQKNRAVREPLTPRLAKIAP